MGILSLETASLVAIWMGSHVLVFFTIREDKLRRAVLILMSLLLVSTYLFKPYTYDLLKYSAYIETGIIVTGGFESNEEGHIVLLSEKDRSDTPFHAYRTFEKGFVFIAELGNRFVPFAPTLPRIRASNGEFEIAKRLRTDTVNFFILCFGLGFCFVATRAFLMFQKRQPPDSWMMILVGLPLILGSIFFFLGSQNTVRQFMGVAVGLGAAGCFIKKNYLASVTLIIFSGLFHRWGPLLGAELVTLQLLTKFGSRNLGHRIGGIGRAILVSDILALGLGMSTLALISIVATFPVTEWDIPLVDDLSQYLGNAEALRGQDRFSGLSKALVLTTLFFLTEWAGGSIRSVEAGNIRSLRRATFLFTLPFAVYPEVFGRLLLLYWGVEMIFVLASMLSSERRSRLVGSIVFVSYGVAPNALNVLVGSQALERIRDLL
jgi:hypothetical protein